MNIRQNKKHKRFVPRTNENKINHPTSEYCKLLIAFSVIAVCVGASHWLSGNWGVM